MHATRLPAASSVTHEHLLACLNTILLARGAEHAARRPVRILDAGCGDGRLTAYLQRSLALMHPDLAVELHGYDVIGHGVQPAGFLRQALERLSDQCPGIDWPGRIHAIHAQDDWPFPAEVFDLVVSNQVLEHVRELGHFARQQRRVLMPGGSGVHLFPLEHYVWEGHLLLPWAHRVKSWDVLRAYIDGMSRLGFGKYRTHHRATGISRGDFAERHADYLFFWTCYLKERDALDVMRAAGLRASFRFTREFYLQKLRALARVPRRASYRARRGPAGDLVKLLRYVSSVTLVCEKQNRYVSNDAPGGGSQPMAPDATARA